MFNFEESQWIWTEDYNTINNYIQFKKMISISDTQKLHTAIIYLSVDSDYALYVNGTFVNCGQFQFGKNKFNVETLNLLNYLKNGLNTICFLVHYQGISTSQYVKKNPGLIYKLQCGEYAFYSDETTYCRKDNCYLTGNYYKITNQLGFNFLYNATKEDDWLENGRLDNTWIKSNCRKVDKEIFELRPILKCNLLNKKSAVLINHGFFKRLDLECSDIAQMMQTDFLTTTPLNELTTSERYLKSNLNNDGIYFIYDLGRETVGHFYIEIETNSNTIIDFSYGEHLKDLRVRAKIGDRNFANRYICKSGKQCFIHRFTRIAGRYIEIHIQNFGNKTKINDIGIIPMEYPVEYKSNILFNDSLYCKIYDIATHTLHICMHEHYEDTPWREQALYAMDSRNQALFGYYCFGEYKFAKASFDLLGESIRKDGFLCITAPNDSLLTIPYFSMMWIVELNEYMMFSGDIEFPNSYIRQTEKMIDTYLSNVSEGMPCPPVGKQYWNFYDWADGLSGKEEEVKKGQYDILYQLFLILAMQAHQNMSKYCSCHEKSYENPILFLKSKVNEIFWNDEMQLYATYCYNKEKYHYCELAQALSLITETCPQEKSQLLREAFRIKNNLIKTTLSHSIFKIQALIQEREKYQDFVLNYIENIWGNMLFEKSTSFWETEKGESDFNGAGSLSHGWSSVPIYVFYAYFLGITPLKPGFKEFSCNPIGNKIAFSNVHTPYGTIHISQNNTINKYDISFPKQIKPGIIIC